MIDFPCHCGEVLSVTEDLAGSSIQCPQCHRLNDIPLLSDLENIDEQGNYKLEDVPNRNVPERIEELTEVFTRNHYDAEGLPIDLRQTPEELNAITPPPVEKGSPKYDPITGELIEPLEIKTDPTPIQTNLPTARRVRAAIEKVGIDVPSPLEVFAIPVRLLKPVNLMVMTFILFAHVLGQFMMTAISSFYAVLIVFWILLHALIIAHFGNVIDETGPTNRNELPTPLRYLNWHDDTFGPFSRIVLALLICYGPAIVLLMYLPMPLKAATPIFLGLSGALALIGTILFPAAVLTSTTSGSFVNLRPDRILGVALACGPEYIIALFAWIIGGSLWLSGTLAINLLGATVLNKSVPVPAGLNWLSAYGALIVGIFIMHLFCWHLGALYRRHFQRFPWIYQRHDHKNNAAPTGFPVTRNARRRRPRPVSSDL
jgi:hypothetical protein